MDKEAELSAELKQFIDQLVVPLLVERVMAETGHLYGVEAPRYDAEERLTPAA